MGSVPTPWTVPSATRARGRRRGRRRRCPRGPRCRRGRRRSRRRRSPAVDGERVALAGEALGDLGGALALGLLLLRLGRGGRGGRRRGGGGGDDRVLGEGGRGGDADLRALGQRAVGAAEDQRERGPAAVDGDARRVGEQVGAVLRDVADAAPLEREASDAAAVDGLAAGGDRGAAGRGGGHEAVEQVDLAGEARGAGGGALGARGAGDRLRGPDLHAAHVHGLRVVALLVVATGFQRPTSPSEPLDDRRLRASAGRRVAPDVAARTAAARSMERAMSAARILRASVANGRLLAGWMAS